MSNPSKNGSHDERPALRRYLLTALIAAAGFAASFVLWLVLGSSDSTSGAIFYIRGVLFYTTFYLTPLLFLTGSIGALAAVLRSRRADKAEQDRGDRNN